MSKRLIIYTSIAATILCCSLYLFFTSPIDVSTLGGKLIQYSDLPPTVADIFRNTDTYIYAKSQNLISTDSTRQYALEAVETGPFTDYFLIIRDREDKFKVSYGKAFPFVIHQGQLFIPTEKNVRNSEKAARVSYERYTLPD